MEIPVKKVDSLEPLKWEEVRKDKEAAEKIDFKMVTFSLGGKDYGIDIMKVAEISKANRFTYVPNALPYVRGVYNLRGDIISVIDLRLMFHLPVPQLPETGLENMIILRLDDYPLAVLVDTIDRVVGISSKKVQPPHPLFGDINIRFISGIVEHENRLFIILDVERIFGADNEEKPRQEEESLPTEVQEDESLDRSELDFQFIVETLATFRNFHHSPVNDIWIRERVEEWKALRKGTAAVQLRNVDDADTFLSSFYSPCTGAFWTDDYRQNLMALMPQAASGSFTAWVVGCGVGYEAYSLTCILRELYPSCRLKVWAQDNDLLAISGAPNLIFQPEDVPSYCDAYIIEGKEGQQFAPEIKDLIMFEYHDVRNSVEFPAVDLIVARDVLSFLTAVEQEKLIKDFDEKLKPSGIIILGLQESLPETEWIRKQEGQVAVYRKR
ncbi:MAG: chemotaxis protein CheW [Spirochaetales bacterium]|nr:chemotaxis protein CheW [Spirochaetales bacterium]